MVNVFALRRTTQSTECADTGIPPATSPIRTCPGSVGVEGAESVSAVGNIPNEAQSGIAVERTGPTSKTEPPDRIFAERAKDFKTRTGSMLTPALTACGSAMSVTTTTGWDIRCYVVSPPSTRQALTTP